MGEGESRLLGWLGERIVGLSVERETLNGVVWCVYIHNEMVLISTHNKMFMLKLSAAAVSACFGSWVLHDSLSR